MMPTALFQKLLHAAMIAKGSAGLAPPRADDCQGRCNAAKVGQSDCCLQVVLAELQLVDPAPLIAKGFAGIA